MRFTDDSSFSKNAQGENEGLVNIEDRITNSYYYETIFDSDFTKKTDCGFMEMFYNIDQYHFFMYLDRA